MSTASDLDHFPETDERCEGCHALSREDCACPKPFSVGDRVVYRPAFGPAEEGTVTSVNDAFVFVCYGLPGSTSKATRREDLEHIRTRRAS